MARKWLTRLEEHHPSLAELAKELNRLDRFHMAPTGEAVVVDGAVAGEEEKAKKGKHEKKRKNSSEVVPQCHSG